MPSKSARIKPALQEDRRVTRRQKIAIILLRFGYANHVPGCWMNAVLILGPEEDWPPRGTVWDAIGARAQRRLARRGFTRDQY